MAGTPSYRKSLGLVGLVSLGVGGTIGSGIFVVPGIAAQLSGVWSLCAWLIVAVSASCVLLSLASVSSRFTDSGSFYSLFESVFGRKAAVPLIVLYLMSSLFGISTIAAGIGQYLGYFGLTQVLLIEIGIIAWFCCINIIGIALSGKTETVLTIIKIFPLILIALLLLPFIRTENFVPAAPLTTVGLFATIIIVYWPFTGFEISAIPVEETTDPRLIRKSLIFVMAIVVSVYLLLNVALIGSVGVGILAASPAPVAAAAALVTKDAGVVVACIGIAAMLSAINAYIVGTSRILQNLSARSGIPLLRDLGAQGTPAYALIVGCGIGAGLLLFSNHFDQLASISVITTLIPYLFFCIASWILITGTRMRLVSAAGAISTLAILCLYFLL
jgi:amino acid transporter